MPKFESAPSINNSEPNPAETGKGVEFPLMVTRDMEQKLADRGTSREDINKLTPENAWEIFNGEKENRVNKK